MFSTTLNINRELFDLLDKISRELNISRAALIRELLKYTCKEMQYYKRMVGLTRYQKKAGKRGWKCFHIEFSEAECRLFFSCRFMYRISVSKLLLIGFVLFINDVTEALKAEKKNISVKDYDSYTIDTSEYNNLIESEVILLPELREEPE